ncbi:MAG TPA: hypothetical protein VMU24_06160 [Candidatus Acidoferrales bacterium]|nr:hypothetical protein [Candidatus Acidoferrales bacterium]
MKSLLRLLLFALLATAFLSAADKSVAGKWNCTSDDHHGAVLHWVLTIGENQGKLSGEITGDMEPLPLIDPRFDGTNLEFKTFINPNCTVAYHVTVKGDSFEGTFECPEVSGTMKGTRTPKS